MMTDDALAELRSRLAEADLDGHGVRVTETEVRALLARLDHAEKTSPVEVQPWRCDACTGAGDRPDCMCNGSGKAVDAVVYLRELLLKMDEALAFYADPETYFAVAFLSDPPAGPFMEDFSETDLGMKPGKLARNARGEKE